MKKNKTKTVNFVRVVQNSIPGGIDDGLGDTKE
jgi:hypothetical protein